MKIRYSLSLLIVIFFNCFSLPLFDYFPELKQKIAYVETIANIPTPVQPLSIFNDCSVFIKRDDLTGFGIHYGGNKCRKLPFVLADALAKEVKAVITVGATGSNHCVATACYCTMLNIPCRLYVKKQAQSEVVKQNLKLYAYYNADITVCATHQDRTEKINDYTASHDNCYVIPAGASTPLGSLGYVNAALELKEQIDAGLIPEPDYIFLPIGSCGTTAGLLLGMCIAGINSKIVAVTTFPVNDPFYFADEVQKLFEETNNLLHDASPTVPLFEFPKDQLTIDADFCGTSYGESTLESQKAEEYMQTTAGITLETTYSAKAFACLLSCIQRLDAQNKVVLFWNTYCGLDFSTLTETIDYKSLPQELHDYFEGDYTV